jgi:uncharacterized FAD-dependent dehydrogenase
MIKKVQITLPPKEVANKKSWLLRVARKLRVKPEQIKEMRLTKKSLDARKAPVRFLLQLDVGVDEKLPPLAESVWECPKIKEGAEEVVIVGSGPAGLFAALRCLELGMKPIVLERGKDASARRFDLAPIMREGRVVEESNYCFGEGGADEMANKAKQFAALGAVILILTMILLFIVISRWRKSRRTQ